MFFVFYQFQFLFDWVYFWQLLLYWFFLRSQCDQERFQCRKRNHPVHLMLWRIKMSFAHFGARDVFFLEEAGWYDCSLVSQEVLTHCPFCRRKTTLDHHFKTLPVLGRDDIPIGTYLTQRRNCTSHTQAKIWPTTLLGKTEWEKLWVSKIS